MQLEAVIFDFGDTLLLTDRWDYDKCLKNLQNSLQKNGVTLQIPYDQFKRIYFEVRDQMYHQSEKALEEVDFRVRISETLERFNEFYSCRSRIIKLAAEAFVDAFIEDLHMENFLPPLLSKLEEIYKLALVSNFAYAPGLRRILQCFSLKRFFDVVVISGEFGLRKPHPKIFEEVLKKLDVAAAKSVFVGDSLKADIYGASRVGLRTILVENVGFRKNPYATAGELDPYPVEPEIRIPNLSKLFDALAFL
ncbi:HAD family hydrolase [Candidatus Bathyarchaeota archaeon]|nr:HAD family hydrolase [Candidatus Bathyarchaeota archaeon]